MTDVNINVEVAENKKIKEVENRGAERGVKEITVNITKNNGTVVTLSTDDVYLASMYGLLKELREMLLEELA